MVPADLEYLRSLLKRNILRGPLLELGAGLPEHSARAAVLEHGLEYVSSDIEGQVDVRADFGDDDEVKRAFASRPPFGSLLIMNVLEHTFEPVRVLDNAMSLLEPGGICVVLTPTVWPIHSYPIDCWRILPDFYATYADKRGHELVWETFEFVGIGPVGNGKRKTKNVQLPPPAKSPAHALYSRIVHKAFNTMGRSMFMPSHVATAVAIRKG
jgi:hypothetical protein